MKVKKITFGGLMLAFAVLIPQMFHLTGNIQNGQMFLPMHMPVLLSGLILGPYFGTVIGILSPIMSTTMTGMPTFARLPFMIIELAAYGFFSGLLYKGFRLCKHKLGLIIVLVLSMLIGRLVYAASLFIASELLQIPCGGIMAAVTATVNGLVGIAIQLTLIPIIVIALERSGFLDKLECK